MAIEVFGAKVLGTILGFLIGVGLQVVFALGCAVIWQTLQIGQPFDTRSIVFAVTVLSLARVFAHLLKLKPGIDR